MTSNPSYEILRIEADAAYWNVKFRLLKFMIALELQGYDPAQPRDEIGRWTSGGGGSADRIHDRTAELVDANNNPVFSPDRSGWHDYTAGPNLVCTAEQMCSREEMKDQLSRFAVPGQPPDKPVENDKRYEVLDPVFGEKVGTVRTIISTDGLTVTNRTYPDHILFDGQITRTAHQSEDGSWYVTTRGTGNNMYWGLNWVNQDAGPFIFDSLDQQLKDNIRAHHGSLQKAVSCIHGSRGGSSALLYAAEITGANYAN